MKTFTVLVVFVMVVVIGGRSWGQNLVPNPSFEDTISCPYGSSMVNHLIDWFDDRYSPDAYNACANQCNCITGIPLNWAGHQQPYDGDGYIGLITYSSNKDFIPAYREYVGIELLQSLIVGTKYYVSTEISLADTLGNACATNKFGFRFSTVQYSGFNPVPIDNYTQVHSDSIISDKENWTKISGSFIADSAYQFLNLGNFYDDTYTDTFDCAHPNPYWGYEYFGYYYVDYVCVSPDSNANCDIALSVPKFLNNHLAKISPNPVQNLLTINLVSLSATATIIVYDVQGRKIVLPTTFFAESAVGGPNNKAELNTATLPDGIYLLQIINNKTGVSEVSKFVKE